MTDIFLVYNGLGKVLAIFDDIEEAQSYGLQDTRATALEDWDCATEAFHDFHRIRRWVKKEDVVWVEVDVEPEDDDEPEPASKASEGSDKICEICGNPISKSEMPLQRIAKGRFGDTSQGSGFAHRECGERHNRNRLPSIGDFLDGVKSGLYWGGRRG